MGCISSAPATPVRCDEKKSKKEELGKIEARDEKKADKKEGKEAMAAINKDGQLSKESQSKELVGEYAELKKEIAELKRRLEDLEKIQLVKWNLKKEDN